MNLKEKFKNVPIKNLIYSISAMLIFNGVLQFLVYPYINRKVGSESYGNILTLLSIIAILAGGFGTGIGNSRLVITKREETKNGDYGFALFIASLISFIIGIGCLAFYNFLSVTEVVFFSVLLIVTLFRYYADVEFKLSLNYLKYLAFYGVIALGYVFGIVIYHFVEVWEIAFLIGEGLCIIYIFLFGKIFKNISETSENKKRVFTFAMSLCIGELLANVILNFDRLLLKYVINGEAVSIYYTASFIGKIVALVTVPLNGVLIGYISKVKGFFPKKKFLLATTAVLFVSGIAFLCCYFVSPIFIKYLYSNLYDDAMKILALAILTQIIFFCSNILMVFVIKFLNSKYQLLINVSYAIVFITISIVASKLYGLNGFAVAAVIGNLFRLILLIAVYLIFGKEKEQTVEE